MIINRTPTTFGGGRITVTFKTLGECQSFEKTLGELRRAIERRPKRRAREEPIEDFAFQGKEHAKQALERLDEIKAILGIKSLSLLEGKSTLKRPMARVEPLPHPAIQEPAKKAA